MSTRRACLPGVDPPSLLSFSRMGLLDNLLNRNPTAAWQPQRGLQLAVDVDTETFSGVTIGDSLRSLEKFGPAEDPKGARLGIYRWPSRGFEVMVEQDRVAEMTFHFYDHERFAGTVKLGGQPLPSGQVREQNIAALMGPPTERDEREGDGYTLLNLRYRKPKGDWMFEFDGDGVLESIWAGKPD